jgi:methyl-accepting chemotaxis protein
MIGLTRTFLPNDMSEETLEVLSRWQSITEFTPEGRILTGNAKCLHALGYELRELLGQHHSILLEPGEAVTAEYRNSARRPTPWAALCT